MLITSKNILSILEDNSISISNKDDIVEKHKHVLERSFNKLNDEQIIHYLLNSKIPKNAKKVLSNKIDSLKEKSKDKKRLFIKKFLEDSIDFWFDVYYDKKDKKNLTRLEGIKKEFIKQNKVREDDLYRDYIPKAIKEIIINNIYDKNLNKLICKSNLPIKIKKEIIDISYDDIDCVDLLIDLRDNDLINYILCTKFNSISGIAQALYSRTLDTEYKKYIVKNKINEYNIFGVATNFYLFDEGKDFLNENCYPIIKKYISKIKNKNLFDEIRNSTSNEFFSNCIVEQREKDIDKRIKRIILPISFRFNVLYRKNEKLMDLIIRKHPYKLKVMILLSNGENTLEWLNVKNIPNNLKNSIIKISSFKINRAIKHLSSYDIMNNYLSKYSDLPKEIQNKIFEFHKDLIISKIKEWDQDYLQQQLLNDSFCYEIKKLIVEFSVNEDNIFHILSKLNVSDEIKNMIIEQKQTIIRKYLINLKENELFKLSKIGDNNAIKKIILSNEDLIISRINAIDEDILYNKLNNQSTVYTIKYIILKNWGIQDEDIFNCLMLINNIDSKIVIYNYNTIKKFIENANINFDSFIQYGCGTEKYIGWLENILNIVNSGREKDFIKVKEYLFNNYYVDDKNKENMVYVISNFLELLNNFSYNYELFMSLLSNNKELTESDKSNLQFLFRNNISCKDINQIIRYKKQFV